jgi:murein DD-endopeptidase MepM/ murein hydrolase activator NlpD
VSFEGTRGGYGNAIVLLHTNSVSTLYGHMSRFAKIIHVGSRVNQGEIIGYVGMTGLATGPHLHYEFLLNGVHMNPQTVRLPGAEPLRAERGSVGERESNGELRFDPSAAELERIAIEYVGKLDRRAIRRVQEA